MAWIVLFSICSILNLEAMLFAQTQGWFFFSAFCLGCSVYCVYREIMSDQ